MIVMTVHADISWICSLTCASTDSILPSTESLFSLRQILFFGMLSFIHYAFRCPPTKKVGQCQVSQSIVLP